MFILFMSILLVSCSNGDSAKSGIKITADVVSEINEIPEQSASESINFEKPESKESENATGDTSQISVSEYYDVEEITEDLKAVLNLSYYNFSRDITDPSYIESSEMGYYVIHTTGNNHLRTFEEFCRYYCGYNWNGFRFFINTTDFDTYGQPLKKSNFTSESEYDSYIRRRILANYTIKEKMYDVENGKVLEYKSWLVARDDVGNFDGNLMPYLLIYKVYCSPNITVLIRPRWEEFSVFKTGTFSEVLVNWEMEDDRVRETALNKSNKILKLCGVKKEFFENNNFKPYFKSEMLSFYYLTYYSDVFNFTTIFNAAAYKGETENELVLDEINVTLVNNDVATLYELKFKITVLADGERDYSY